MLGKGDFGIGELHGSGFMAMYVSISEFQCVLIVWSPPRSGHPDSGGSSGLEEFLQLLLEHIPR